MVGPVRWPSGRRVPASVTRPASRQVDAPPRTSTAIAASAASARFGGHGRGHSSSSRSTPAAVARPGSLRSTCGGPLGPLLTPAAPRTAPPAAAGRRAAGPRWPPATAGRPARRPTRRCPAPRRPGPARAAPRRPTRPGSAAAAGRPGVPQVATGVRASTSSSHQARCPTPAGARAATPSRCIAGRSGPGGRTSTRFGPTRRQARARSAIRAPYAAVGQPGEQVQRRAAHLAAPVVERAFEQLLVRRGQPDVEGAEQRGPVVGALGVPGGQQQRRGPPPDRGGARAVRWPIRRPIGGEVPRLGEFPLVGLAEQVPPVGALRGEPAAALAAGREQRRAQPPVPAAEVEQRRQQFAGREPAGRQPLVDQFQPGLGAAAVDAGERVEQAGQAGGRGRGRRWRVVGAAPASGSGTPARRRRRRGGAGRARRRCRAGRPRRRRPDAGRCRRGRRPPPPTSSRTRSAPSQVDHPVRRTQAVMGRMPAGPYSPMTRHGRPPAAAISGQCSPRTGSAVPSASTRWVVVGWTAASSTGQRSSHGSPASAAAHESSAPAMVSAGGSRRLGRRPRPGRPPARAAAWRPDRSRDRPRRPCRRRSRRPASARARRTTAPAPSGRWRSRAARPAGC